MKNFEIIEHTADIGIIAYGKTKEEVFVNSAKGMFYILTEEKEEVVSKNKFSYQLKLSADTLEDLLVSWLNELLYIFETKLVILNKFVLEEFSDNNLIARVYGEDIGHNNKKIKREIKAVTYHYLEFKKDEVSKLWRARVIFDI
ncbi:MAG: archease [Candidatus Caldatribacteriota bacterium]